MPGQRLLKGLREVEKTPANDDIIVKGHKETHLQHKRTRRTPSVINDPALLISLTCFVLVNDFYREHGLMNVSSYRGTESSA